MKKLSLKNLDLSASERLQKEQLKSVFGGYGGYGIGCDPNIERGYFFNNNDNCWHYGTLITASNCDTHFVSASIQTQMYFPKKCGYYV